MLGYQEEKLVKRTALVAGLRAEIASHEAAIVTLGRQLGNGTKTVEEIKTTITEIGHHLEILDYLAEELHRAEAADASSL
jgi:CII-binding regulator of phage lambda lysogenization HflD